jgi:hypothetical protein
VNVLVAAGNIGVGLQVNVLIAAGNIGEGLQVNVLVAAGNIGVGLQVDVLIAAGKTECSIGSKYLPRQGLPTTTSNAIGKNDHKKKENITKRRALSDLSIM